MRLSALLLGLLLLSSSIGALQAQPKPTVSIDSYQISLGSTQTIPIVIKNAGSIAGGSVNITFNRSILEVIEVVADDFPMITSNINNSGGFVVISAISAKAIGKDETILANITIRGISVGECPLAITWAELSDENGNLITPNIENGSVRVLGATTTPATTVTTTVTTTATQTTTATTTIISTVTAISPTTVIRYFTSVTTRIVERRIIDIFYTIIVAGLTAIILVAIFLIVSRRTKRPRLVGVR